MFAQRFLAVLLAIFLVFFTGILGLSFFIYPKLVEEKTKVDALWVPVQKTLAAREAIVKRAENVLPDGPEKAALAAAHDKIQRAQVRDDFAPDLPEHFAFYRGAQEEFAALAGKLIASPAVPEPLRAEFAANQSTLLAQEQQFDAAVEKFNALVARRPQSIVAAVFKFYAKGTFLGPPVAERR